MYRILKIISKIFKKILGSIFLLNYFIFIKRNKNLKKNPKDYRINFSTKKIKKIIFIYKSSGKNNASTVMRVFQLRNILKFEGEINTEVFDENNLSKIKNSICILNKSFLTYAKPIDFEILLLKKNILCLDYIDSEEQLFQIKYCHALIASSIKQYNYFNKKYSQKYVHLITHHVDPRLNLNLKNFSALKIGYFGEKENTIYNEKIQKLVDYNFIDTKNQSQLDWLKRINNYNANYIIRNRIRKNIFKPFLKGFTAAHMKSNLIAYSKDGDTKFYLTEDYPYLINELSSEKIIGIIDFMKETYKTKTWFEALEIMNNVKNKSSNKYIINEFKKLINTLNFLST